MISDLLADSNLPPNVASTLKIISTMIAPPTAFHVGQRPFVSPMTPLIEKFRDEHQEDKVKDQPDLKDDLPLPMVGVSILQQYASLCIGTRCPLFRASAIKLLTADNLYSQISRVLKAGFR